MKNHLAKILFGIVIFLFSVALAYFTANYLSTSAILDYWGTLAIFACAYVVIGIAVVWIFPISLGFLFAADILILHLLGNYYGQWADVLKLTTVGVVLAIAYGASALWLKDVPVAAAPVIHPPQQ